MRRYTRLPIVLLAFGLLAGLGGCSSGDSNDSSSPPPPPTTGVVSAGVITGFGSVYVNGVRYDTSGAEVTMNGAAATEADLKVGQYVQLKGHVQGEAHHADVIRYHNVLEGPITAIDLPASTFAAMGQTVRVTSDTSLGDEIAPASIEGLAVGDVVEVSGVVSTQGVIDATRVDIKPDGGPYDVTGYVSNVDTAAKRFNITALVVDYSTANMADFPTGAPSDGDLVLVKGSVFDADGVLVALHVELRSDDWMQPGAGDELEVEGAINDFVSPTEFKVAGWPVTTTAATIYEHGTAATLANDVLVEVEGTANDTGVLVAQKIRFKEVNTIRIVAQVSELVAAQGTLKMLALSVMTDQATRYEDMTALAVRDMNFSNIAVGDWLDVRGYEDPVGSNAVRATRVVRIDAQETVRLRGECRNAAQPDFHILSTLVATTDLTKFRAEDDASTDGTKLTVDMFFYAAPGEIVEAWGGWNGTVLTADRVEIKVNDH